MHDFTPASALVGGALIGLAASLFFLTHGRTAGISGLWARLLQPDTGDRELRLWFFAGLVGAGAVLGRWMPQSFGVSGPWVLTAVAGLLVGYGTRLGGGCTSGHGVCGISRFELRSVVATITFIATGALTVAVLRRFLGAP